MVAAAILLPSGPQLAARAEAAALTGIRPYARITTALITPPPTSVVLQPSGPQLAARLEAAALTGIRPPSLIRLAAPTPPPPPGPILRPSGATLAALLEATALEGIRPPELIHHAPPLPRFEPGPVVLPTAAQLAAAQPVAAAETPARAVVVLAVDPPDTSMVLLGPSGSQLAALLEAAALTGIRPPSLIRLAPPTPRFEPRPVVLPTSAQLVAAQPVIATGVYRPIGSAVIRRIG